ncbi:zinc-ribbon domain and TM2 domain-containing protein [Cellulosilyticum ruminicola]|uniref:zinc-ribbon domain and TM2 domain-containing protein n=1 Tax=Cellulosilyticum ruminicola TaxID=425254 RepID=UPI0009F91E3F|nr:TM2 domain-containing protein [Cellulosilyticum ruminicola]
MYCINCGNQISDDSNFCPECGAQQNVGTNNTQEGQYYYKQDYQNGNFTNNNYGYNNYNMPKQKSRLVAGLLQIFLGCCGAGRFYLGYTGMGLGQLFSNFLCGAGYIWAFIDGILILCGRVQTDARGIPLRD